uniref:Putative transcription initiation factor tfiid subunit 3 n=1 Tax=Ornithodoros turicata TaxID=34597 RepID=A0A2R5LDV4_9ACAR
MAAQFSRSILKVSVAQICQNVGWHAVHQSTLELLVDILHRYMVEVAKSAQAYSNHYGSTEPNLDDLSMAFGDLGILVSELEEYVSNVEPVQFVESRLPHYPVSRSSTSNSGNKLHHWVHEFPTHSTDLEEEEELAMSPGAPDGGGPSPRKEGAAGATNSAGEEMIGSPDASPQPSKRASDGCETPTPKRFRLCVEEEGQPMREVTSVFMTPSGLISPAREGKLPEATMPSKLIAVDEVASDSLDSTDFPCKEIKLKDAKKALKKESKKVRPSKKDKENSDLKKALFLPVGKGTHSIFKLKKKLNKKAKFQKDLIAPKLKIKEAKSKSKGSKVKEEKKEGKSKEGKSKEGKVKVKSKSKKNKGDAALPGTSSAVTPGHSPKLSKGKSPMKAKSPARSKSPKGEKKKTVAAAPVVPPPAAPPLSPPVPPFTISNMTPLQVMACKAEEERIRLNAATAATQQVPPPPEPIMKDEPYEIPSREESPEPRLIIDDSPEMISRQERESRLADIEQCIDAVIQKAREEMIEDEKRESAAEALLVHGAMMPRKLEPRDVYDFTDSDSDSSMPPTPKTPDLAGSPNPKKEAKTPPEIVVSEHKKKEGGKSKKKSGSKAKSGTPSPKKGLPKTPELRGSPLVALSQRAESPERGPSFSGVFPFSQHGGLFSPRFPGSGVMGSPLGPQQQGSFLPTFPFSHMGRCGTAFPTPPLFVPPTSRGPSNDVTSPGSSPPMNLSSSAFPTVKTVAEKKGVPSLSPVPPKLSKEPAVAPKSHGDTEKSKVVEQKEKISPPKKKAKEGKSNKKSKTKTGKEKKSKEEKKDDSIPKITVKLASKPSATKLLLKAMTQVKEPSQPPEESPSRRSPSPPLLTPSVPPPSVPPAPPVSVANSGKSGSKGGAKAPSSSSSASTSKATVPKQGPTPQPTEQPEPPSSLPAARMVVTETVGTIVDERGNKIWICPACARPDDGSPMIGCDECDDWYHWVCVGIVVPPKEEESWFCNRCIARRQGALAKKKKKKHRKDK